VRIIKKKIVFCYIAVLVIIFGHLQYSGYSSKNENGSESIELKSDSYLIFEDKDDFLEGIMENLTISEDNELLLDITLKNNWTQRFPSTKPSARYGHSMVYDSTHDRVILFGGDDDFYDDTWAYNYTDNTWTNMTTSSDKPSARYYHSMVYDSTHDRVILFGGLDGNRDDETWVYNYTDNTWTNLTTSLNKPSARWSHSMVYDSTHDRVILFGGDTMDGYSDEAWIYDYFTNTWTNMTTRSTKPSARSGHSMVYDSTHDRVILFGGFNGGGFNNETWESLFQEDYYQKGIYCSNIKDLNNIYKITGNMTWAPYTQPIGTTIQFQIGISNTSSEGDFIFTSISASSYKFNGTGRYLKYLANFSSDSSLSLSPKITEVNITCFLEPIDVESKGPPEDILMIVLISCAFAGIAIGVIIIVKKRRK